MDCPPPVSECLPMSDVANAAQLQQAILTLVHQFSTAAPTSTVSAITQQQQKQLYSLAALQQHQLNSYSRKRGPDDLSSTLSNGGLQAVMTIDTEAKKPKLDSSVVGTGVTNTNLAAVSTTASSTSSNGHQPAPRSRVVHLRNIPPDMTDVELIHICIPFGKITNFLLLKGKNQAFVEFEDDNCAASLVSVTNACPISLRGRTIFCQFSNHQELKTDNKNAFNAGATNIIQQSMDVNQQQPVVEVVHYVNNANLLVVGSGDQTAQLQTTTQQQPNSVLRVIIENMIYPVTLDVLHSIFSRFGKVLRIITFNKNNTFQALIQLSEAGAAQCAKQALDGQNVYNGCCTLRIDYSKLATLNVKYNNDKSRDYTNPNLPSGELTLEQQLSLAAAAAGGHLGSASITSLALQSPFALPFGTTTPTTAAYAMPQHLSFQQAALLAQQQQVQQQQQQQQQQQAVMSANPFLQLASGGNYGMGAGGGTGTAASPNGGMLNVTPNAAAAAALRAFPQLGAMAIPPVVLVSNLDENKVTTDALFTLFGVYGDVQRVKILFNKKDNALIQFAEPAQAQLAINHLDKLVWHGKQVRVTASKHNNVQMPKEGQPDAGLTKDYSQSPLHRFKKPGSKNYMNIYQPSATLHLSNIPPGINDDFLVQAFDQAGFEVKGFKFFPKDHKMALLQLKDVESAVDALIIMHNFKLAENAHLRVSFSKSGI